MSEKRFWFVIDKGKLEYVQDNVTGEKITVTELEDLLNEQEQKIQRWKKLYEIKDAEVTARVDGLNKVCEYYLTEAQFKADTDPNQAVKEVINEILNTEVKK